MSSSVENSALSKSTAYDETPYPSSSFPQSHPNRLAAMARIFGLPAANPLKARVLELGCADGSNLLPMAEMAPEATFVGIDASKVQLSAGQAALAAAGLKNVELRLQNILDFPASEGKFDYIVVHGIYSWVSEPVREKILQICQDHLTDDGIAYISYNALPGWNMRRSLRDMMMFHTAGIADPKIKVQQARAMLKFIADSVPTENNAYGLMLRSESEFLGKQLDNYLRHDLLEEENTAFYFHQFIAQAAKHGLQYLSEPNLSQMLAGNFPDKVRETLAKLGNNIIAQEQYMDFLRNRMFRQTLLCRNSAKVQRQVRIDRMKELSFQSLLGRLSGPVDLTPGVTVAFTGLGGVQINSSDAFVKAVLQTLAQSGARSLAYTDLLNAARALSRPLMGEVPPNRDQIDEATLLSNLMNLYSKGFVELHAEPVAIRLEVPEKPAVSALVRHQAMNARLITNRVHQAVPIDVLGRYIVEACDGMRTREDILALLVERVKEGKLQAKESNQPVTDPEKLSTLFAPRVDNVLRELAYGGFFAP